LETPEGQGILKALPPEQQRELLNIEFKRIHLNHVVGLLQYEIARLKRLESEFEAWRDRMRDVNQH
jgi:adenylosuccinate lyase